MSDVVFSEKIARRLPRKEGVSQHVEGYATVLYTENAPITKGRGDAELASVEDIEVVVDGAVVEADALNPVLGIVFLKQAINPEADVVVRYYHTPNPVLEITALNSPSYRLNQWGGRTALPFPYKAVLGPYKRPQPRKWEYRYSAFDYPYTSVLNDPTSLLLNEPKHKIRIPPLEKQWGSTTVFYEGLQGHPGGFQHVGPALGEPQYEEDLYVLEDKKTSTTIVDGAPSFFQKPIETSYGEYAAILNARLKILEYQKTNDFTGIALGFSSDRFVYFMGFLEIDGFKTVGVLQEREQSRWQSYGGLEAEVEAPDVIRFESQPPMKRGDSLFIEGHVVTVIDISTIGTGWEVTLEQALPQTGRVRVFLEVEWDTEQTYRAVRNKDGDFLVYMGSSVTPIIQARTVTERTLNVEPQHLFFGSLDPKTTSKSGWRFVRFSSQPLVPTTRDRVVEVRPDLREDLGEQEWARPKDDGYSRATGEGLLVQGVGQKIGVGGVTFTKMEPLLTSDAVVDLEVKLNVRRYATGMASFLTIQDEKRCLSLALYDDKVQYARDVIALPSRGFWGTVDAITLVTRGYLEGFGEIPEDQYFSLYSGTRLFQDAGWQSTFEAQDVSFYDAYAAIELEGGTRKVASHTDTSDIAVENITLSCRIKIGAYVAEADGSVPVYWGVDDGVYQIYVKLWEASDSTRYVVFCDEEGRILYDGVDPVGVAYEWSRGEFKNYVVNRYGQNLTVFVDGEYVGAVDATLLEGTASPGIATTRFFAGEKEVQVGLDFLYAHSLHARNRRIGIHKGGDPLDPLNYEYVEHNWLGNSTKLRVRRDPSKGVELFLDGTSVMRTDYDALPYRDDAGKEGAVTFGVKDPNALSETLWESLRYRIINRRTEQGANNNAYLNRHNTITSPDEVGDSGPVALEVLPQDKKIYLLKYGHFAETVMGVTSLDGTTTYSFAYDHGRNVVEMQEEVRTDVRVVFQARKPRGEAYLESREAYTQLYEGTPPVPLRQEVGLSAVRGETPVLGSDATSLVTSGFGGGAGAGTLLTSGYINQGEEGGPLTIRFERNPDAYYQNLRMLKLPDSGDPDALSIACDDLGLKALDFVGPFGEDEYVMPLQGDEEQKNTRVGQFNDYPSTQNPGTVLNDAYAVSLGIEKNYSFTFILGYEDELGPVTDTPVRNHPQSFMEDHYGKRHAFNNPFYTLNGPTPIADPLHNETVPVRTNTWEEEGVIYDLDFESEVPP